MKKDGSRGETLPRKMPQRAAAEADPPSIRENLATEMYTLVRLALARSGVTPVEQARAQQRSNELQTPPAVSGPLLRDARGLGNLLLEWSRASDYLDRQGQPRILRLEGPGATFESLVKRFMPTKSVAEALALAQETTEISLRSRGRIALVGSILVKLTNTPENVLAHAIRHLDQLLTTSLHNKEREDGDPSLEGRMERMVIGVILRERFPDLMADLRPQIYDILQRVDRSVEQRQPTTTDDLTRSTALSVGIYISQEDNWDRAGIAPETIIRPPSDSE